VLAAAIAGCATAADVTPARVDEFVARHWRAPLAPQGAPPARFSPLEASLAPESCGACHPLQYADWRTSLHAAAMGPGVAGQLADMLVSQPLTALGCQGCHAPLAEQAPLARGATGLVTNPDFDEALRGRGVTCAACHVRGHERFAPPRRDGSLASAAPRDSLPHGGATRTPAFLRSEFCRGCHQFAADGFTVNGKLLENTYEEWRASRFAREGVQCQDCHMPDRRHLWRGIHDPAMVRAGLTIGLARAVSAGGALDATLSVANTGVGHAFPTYIPPRVVLRAELLGADGRPLAGTRQERVIGRHVELDMSREFADTRLSPGERVELHYAPGVVAGAIAARFSVVVEPDAFYTSFFETLLAQGVSRGTEQLEAALAATRRSPFTVFVEDVELR